MQWAKVECSKVENGANQTEQNTVGQVCCQDPKVCNHLPVTYNQYLLLNYFLFTVCYYTGFDVLAFYYLYIIVIFNFIMSSSGILFVIKDIAVNFSKSAIYCHYWYYPVFHTYGKKYGTPCPHTMIFIQLFVLFSHTLFYFILHFI